MSVIYTPRTGIDLGALEPGDRVRVHYWGYDIIAAVVEVEPLGRYGPQLGWVTVEQITDYEDREQRPRFEACADYITAP